MKGFGDIFAAESRRMWRRLGWMGLAVLGGIVVFLGYVIPRYWSYQFLDPKITLIYCALAMIFVLPQAVESLARIEPTEASPVVFVGGKLAALVAWAWGTSTVLLAVGLVSLNVIKHAGGRLMPETPFLAAALLLGLLFTVFVAELAVLLTLHLGSADVAKRVLRIAMFIVVAGLLFGSRVSSANWSGQLRLAALNGTFATAAFLGAPGLALVDLLLLRAIVGAIRPRT